MHRSAATERGRGVRDARGALSMGCDWLGLNQTTAVAVRKWRSGIRLGVAAYPSALMVRWSSWSGRWRVAPWGEGRRISRQGLLPHETLRRYGCTLQSFIPSQRPRISWRCGWLQVQSQLEMHVEAAMDAQWKAAMAEAQAPLRYCSS